MYTIYRVDKVFLKRYNYHKFCFILGESSSIQNFSLTFLKRGGEVMVEDTIRAIRETEDAAGKIAENADEESVKIIAEAETKAKAIKEDAFKAATQAAKDAMSAEKERGDKEIEAAMAKVNDEIAQLKADAAGKEASAIAEVIASLV